MEVYCNNTYIHICTYLYQCKWYFELSWVQIPFFLGVPNEFSICFFGTASYHSTRVGFMAQLMINVYSNVSKMPTSPRKSLSRGFLHLPLDMYCFWFVLVNIYMIMYVHTFLDLHVYIYILTFLESKLHSWFVKAVSSSSGLVISFWRGLWHSIWQARIIGVLASLMLALDKRPDINIRDGHSFSIFILEILISPWTTPSKLVPVNKFLVSGGIVINL